MDPITAGLNLLNSALILGTKVWDATPHDQQVAAASDWAKFTHNIADSFISLESKITAVTR